MIISLVFLMSETILIFGLIFFLGHFFTLLFKKTWIPDVLLLMVLGIVMGSVLHLVSPVDFGKVGGGKQPEKGLIGAGRYTETVRIDNPDENP